MHGVCGRYESGVCVCVVCVYLMYMHVDVCGLCVHEVYVCCICVCGVCVHDVYVFCAHGVCWGGRGTRLNK